MLFQISNPHSPLIPVLSPRDLRFWFHLLDLSAPVSWKALCKVQFKDKKQRRLVPRASRTNTPKEIIKPIQKLYYVLCIVWNEVLMIRKTLSSTQTTPLGGNCLLNHWVCTGTSDFVQNWMYHLLSTPVRPLFFPGQSVVSPFASYPRQILAYHTCTTSIPTPLSNQFKLQNIFKSAHWPAPLSLFNICPNHHHASHGHL